MSQNRNNPYAQAAGAYDSNAQSNTTDQRELEGRVLLKSNRMIQELIDNWDNRGKEQLEDTLTYNRQIWMLFYDTAIENKDGNAPNDLRSNIINLANFIFKREIDILSNPDKKKLDILININREIAAGLMTKPQEAVADDTQQATPNQPPPAAGSTTDISG